MPPNSLLEMQVRELKVGQNRILLIPAMHTIEPDVTVRTLVDPERVFSDIPHGVDAIGMEMIKGLPDELEQYHLESYKPRKRYPTLNRLVKRLQEPQLNAFLQKARDLKALVLLIGPHIGKNTIEQKSYDDKALAKLESGIRLLGLKTSTRYRAIHFFDDAVTAQHLIDAANHLQDVLGRPVTIAYATHPLHVDWLSEIIGADKDVAFRALLDFNESPELRCPIRGLEWAYPGVLPPNKLKFRFW